MYFKNIKVKIKFINTPYVPWLVWLSALSAGLRRVAGSIPSQGTCLVCRSSPQ